MLIGQLCGVACVAKIEIRIVKPCIEVDEAKMTAICIASAT